MKKAKTGEFDIPELSGGSVADAKLGRDNVN